MIKYALILFSVLTGYSCSINQKNIHFNIKNNSNFKVDSVMIKMGEITLKTRNTIAIDSLLDLKISYNPNLFTESGVGILYYYSKEKGYWSNFGYFENKSYIKEIYNLYIYDNGVSEIERETNFLNKNEITPH